MLFLLKNANFLQKNVNISKIKRALVLTVIFSETTYVCGITWVDLCAKFEVSGIILTRFRQGIIPHLKTNP